MYVKHPKSKEAARFRQPAAPGREIHPENELPEGPRSPLIAEHSSDVLLHWRAPEYEVFERDQKWYIVITAILVAIIAWALYTNSPIMAITFILIGVVGYLTLTKEPRTLDFIITRDGLIVDQELYEFDNCKSFWIFYEPEGKRAISLHMDHSLVPYVHLPIHDEDPVRIREILLEHLEEEKHEPGVIETVERLLKI
jgi:hypothetical protein